MNGVRLSDIKGNISLKHIKDILHHHGLQVDKIYYPLHNNEAVVLFIDTTSTSKALCEKLDGLAFKVSPLPHKVISKVTVELESNAVALLSDDETRTKFKKKTKDQVKIEESDGCYVLEGGQFDIEVACSFLSQEIEEQFTLANYQNGHDPSLALSSKSRQNVNDAKVPSPRTSERRSVAAGIQASTAKPSNGYERLPNGDIPAGAGFSFSRATSVEESGHGRNSRDADASRTFEKFASLPGERSQSGQSKSFLERELATTREKYSRETELEARGAVGGRNSDAELNHRRDRDSKYSSFSSTFAGDASMLRDLDNAPKGDLAAIEKWVEETRTKDIPGGERGSTCTDELLKESEETHPMLYDHGQSREGEKRSGSSLINNLEDTSQPRRPYRASDFADETKNLEFKLPGGIVVKVHYGDIVKIRTDGIVNAANSELQHYAGVAGAIERACGRNLTRECERYIRQNGPLNVSEVMHTTSGDLIALGTSYIIHTVGPVYVESLESKCGNLLTCTFLRCLDYARKKLRIRSVAFPFISAGVYGAPLELCVESFLDAVVMYAKTHQDDTNLREIHLVNTDLEMVQTAIVMIKQHLEQGFEVLVSKAMLRLEKKSPRSPRGEVKSQRSSSTVKRSSSLSRTVTKASDRSEYSSLRPEDLHFTEDDPNSVKPIPRRRSGSFNAPRTSSSDKTRPNSATAAVTSESRKTTGSPRADISKSMKSYNIQTGTDRMKTRPGTTTAASRSGPMRAIPSQSGTLVYDESSDRDSRNLKFSHTYHGQEDFRSLPADVNRVREGRPLPVPRKYEEEEKCPICMEPVLDPLKLDKCSHVFCSDCIRKAFKQRPACPVCGKLYGTVTGDQPKGGRMSNQTLPDVQVPGYKGTRGAISIEYYFPGGHQQENHPNPGMRYAGIKRTAYLPNNIEGREVLRLLEKAFKAGVTFTIGDSRTTGQQGVITWNDIHHKTSLTGGPESYGYPDPDYLKRVKEELADKGITG